MTDLDRLMIYGPLVYAALGVIERMTAKTTEPDPED